MSGFRLIVDGKYISFPKGHKRDFMLERIKHGLPRNQLKSDYQSFVEDVKYHPVETNGTEDAQAWSVNQ